MKILLRIVLGVMAVYGMWLSYPIWDESEGQYVFNLFDGVCFIIGVFAWTILSVIAAFLFTCGIVQFLSWVFSPTTIKRT